MTGPPRWLGGRALALHVALLCALSLCTIAAWWQVQRALGGNTLSWLYVFEWPAFALVGAWLWWVLMTSPGRPAGVAAAPAVASSRADLLARRRAPLRWDPAAETAHLQAYNAFLADLNAGRRSDRPRATGRRAGR